MPDILDPCCYDCSFPYIEFGYDVVLPNDIWRKISPDGEGNGLLCPNCMMQRLRSVDMPNVVVWRLKPEYKPAEKLMEDPDVE